MWRNSTRKSIKCLREFNQVSRRCCNWSRPTKHSVTRAVWFINNCRNCKNNTNNSKNRYKKSSLLVVANSIFSNSRSSPSKKRLNRRLRWFRHPNWPSSTGRISTICWNNSWPLWQPDCPTKLLTNINKLASVSRLIINFNNYSTKISTFLRSTIM